MISSVVGRAFLPDLWLHHILATDLRIGPPRTSPTQTLPPPNYTVRPWYKRLWAWLWSRKDHARSVFLVVLRSRWAKYVEQLLALAVLVIAAGPDFGLDFLSGGRALVALLVVFAASRLWTLAQQGTTIDEYQRELTSVGGIISVLAGIRGGTSPRLLADPERTIGVLLRRVRDIAQATVKTPVGQELTAHLVLPSLGTDGSPTALQVVQHHDFEFDRAHDPIPLDAPGVGEAFTTGRPQVIPNIADFEYFRLEDRPYCSVTALPIIAGDPAEDGKVIGVVSIDSTHPYTFTERNLKRVSAFLAPVVQLVGLATEVQQLERADDEEE